MGELYLRNVVVDIYPPTGSGKRLEGLRVKFKCEKTLSGEPNKAEIEIYNIAEDTRNMLLNQKTRVRLAIGYLGFQPKGFLGTGLGGSSNVETVFIGNIKKFNSNKTPTRWEGVDIITKIELADGGNAYRNARLDKGYPPGATLKMAIDDVSKALGLPKSAFSAIPDVQIAHGISLSGLAKDHLDTLTKPYGFEWSIQDETLQITQVKNTSGDATIVLTPQSGLVGSPNVTDKGVEIKSLVQPQLRPGRRILVKSKIMTGIFKINKVTHEGDSHEGDFLSKCECKKLAAI